MGTTQCLADPDFMNYISDKESVIVEQIKNTIKASKKQLKSKRKLDEKYKM
jgi:hypothetical protein